MTKPTKKSPAVDAKTETTKKQSTVDSEATEVKEPKKMTINDLFGISEGCEIYCMFTTWYQADTEPPLSVRRGIPVDITKHCKTLRSKIRNLPTIVNAMDMVQTFDKQKKEFLSIIKENTASLKDATPAEKIAYQQVIKNAQEESKKLDDEVQKIMFEIIDVPEIKKIPYAWIRKYEIIPPVADDARTAYNLFIANVIDYSELEKEEEPVAEEKKEETK